MLPEYTSHCTGDHVEESAANMCEQYAQPQRRRGSHQVGPENASDNGHAFHSQCPGDRLLAVNSSTQ